MEKRTKILSIVFALILIVANITMSIVPSQAAQTSKQYFETVEIEVGSYTSTQQVDGYEAGVI